jgi:hypothetical protein
VLRRHINKWQRPGFPVGRIKGDGRIDREGQTKRANYST